MKKRLIEAVKDASEFRALLVLIVLLSLRAWRAIPKLRPIHLAIPATLVLVTTLILAALSPSKYIITFSIGLFIVLAIFMFPMLRQPQKPTAHWVGTHK
jgi:hypothetical protein